MPRQHLVIRNSMMIINVGAGLPWQVSWSGLSPQSTVSVARDVATLVNINYPHTFGFRHPSNPDT